MAKWVKRSAIALGSILILAGLAVVTGLRLADSKMNRQIDVKVQAIALPTEPTAIERGKYLYNSRGCTECHGVNGAGRTLVEEAGLLIHGANISPAPGSAVANYRVEDWIRAIRHGVHTSGRPLMIMPSEDYNRFTDADLGALIAYIKSLPPANGGPAVVQLPLPARVLYGFGAIEDAAAKIDHKLPPAQPVAEGVTLEHGRYVANMCLGCHGPQLAGGRIPGAPPDWPPASRLAAGEGSVMPRYAKAEALIALFRSGKRADGTAVSVMPFESLRQMSETDLRALHLYLSSLGKG